MKNNTFFFLLFFYGSVKPSGQERERERESKERVGARACFEIEEEAEEEGSLPFVFFCFVIHHTPTHSFILASGNPLKSTANHELLAGDLYVRTA